MRRLITGALFAYLRVFYRAKAALLRLIAGDEALAYVLHDSLFPALVLQIGGAKLGRNTRINRWLTIHESRGSFRNLTIGDDVHIGKHVLIDLTGRVTIGNRAGIGMYSRILTHQNLGDSALSEKYPPEAGDIIIPDDVVLAAGSMVLYPTVLQPGTLVSAGSVTRGTYDRAGVLVGNPARMSLDWRRSGEAKE
jgi:acetyltransferase-like isoleucine patch superfamily enzyme